MTNTNGLTSKGIQEGKLAVVTGGADGIGLACAEALANKGMRIALVDKDAEKLADAANSLPASCEARTFCIDVTDREAMLALGERVRDELGDVSVLMNNAAMAANPGAPWENPEGWDTLLDVNLTGVMNGVFAFVPAMIASGASGCVINTGSKQGITRPPGNAAYNVSKTAVLGYSEMLSHALRNSDNANISAHLLVPGFTYTGMIRVFLPEKPDSAWWPSQVAEFMLEGLAHDDFYILCPDNDVDRAIDEKRIAWNTGDIVKNRPALSRWHPDFSATFEAYMSDD